MIFLGHFSIVSITGCTVLFYATICSTYCEENFPPQRKKIDSTFLSLCTYLRSRGYLPTINYIK